MPIITYSPQGIDPYVFEFEFTDLLMPEAIAVQKASGVMWDDVPDAFMQGNVAVTYALFQVLAKRAGLDGRAAQPRVGELARELTTAEYRNLLDYMLSQVGRDRAAWTEDQAAAVNGLAEFLGVDDPLAEPEPAEADSDGGDLVLDDGSDETSAEVPEDPKA